MIGCVEPIDFYVWCSSCYQTAMLVLWLPYSSCLPYSGQEVVLFGVAWIFHGFILGANANRIPTFHTPTNSDDKLPIATNANSPFSCSGPIILRAWRTLKSLRGFDKHLSPN